MFSTLQNVQMAEIESERKLFNSNNSYLRIVAHNPIIHKVKPITDAYNLQDETLSENFWIWMKNNLLQLYRQLYNQHNWK